MAKSKNKKHHSSSAPARKPAATPRERGAEFFRRSNYLEAARQWETLPLENDAALKRALAEAHLRRALDAQGHPAAVEALQAALALAPDDTRILYHLALALHRENRLEEAGGLYARLMQSDARPAIQKARALAALEADANFDLAAAPWLGPAVCQELEPVARMLRDQSLPAAAKSAATENAAAESDAAESDAAESDAAEKLWHGLNALQRGDDDAARALLARGKERPLRNEAEVVRAFYHGVAAARLGKSVAALENWDEAAHIARKAKIEPPAQLDGAIAGLLRGRLHELRASEQWDVLLHEARSAPETAQTRRAVQIALHHLGLQAARENQWPRAAERWNELRASLETQPDDGPLPPVMHNLALALEKSEDLEAAVALWEELIKATTRRGGKRKNLSAPEEQQRARQDAELEWRRRHVLELLQQLGDPEPAIAHFKKAIKAAPNDLELRLELAGALLANEQPLAAINETERILERDPKNVDALLLQALAVEEERGPFFAEGVVRRALAVAPDNEDVRQTLGQMLLHRGMSDFNYGNPKNARGLYLEALELMPDDLQLRVFLAETELKLGQKKSAHERIAAILANDDNQALMQVFGLWARQENIENARALVERVQAQGRDDFPFYGTVGSMCFGMAEGDEWENWGYELLEIALEKAPDMAGALQSIVELLSKTSCGPVAIPYMKRLVQLKPDDPDELMKLAILQAMNDQKDDALETLKGAERLARQFRDRELQRNINELRQKIKSPFFGMFNQLLNDIPDDF